MNNRFHFLIQIVGNPKSGKSTIAKAIEKTLKDLGAEVYNDDSGIEENLRDVSHKKVLINTFSAQKDRQIIQE